MYKIVLIVSLLFALFSCKNEVKKPIHKHKAKLGVQWLMPVFFTEEMENEFSFPNWFNDSMIRANSIYKITKRKYYPNEDESVDSLIIKQSFPKEKREFYFDDKGRVNLLVIYTYMDDQEISRTGYNYTDNLDRFGFRNAHVSLMKHVYTEQDENPYVVYPENEEDNGVLFYLAKEEKKYSVYVHEESDFKYFVTRTIPKHNFNPFKKMDVQEKDWLISPSFRNPEIRYQVGPNKSKLNKTVYTYWEKHLLKTRKQKTADFIRKRNYIYNNQGIWTAYSDSIFSNKNFIHSIHHQFQFDKFDRPIQIKHIRSMEENNHLLYLETIRYEKIN